MGFAIEVDHESSYWYPDEAYESDLSATAAAGAFSRWGDVATLACEVAGAEGAELAYQWQYSSDGETWKSLTWEGADTASLSKDVNSSRANKVYRCVVTAADGRVAETGAVSFVRL